MPVVDGLLCAMAKAHGHMLVPPDAADVTNLGGI
jgi:hypothetical protein